MILSHQRCFCLYPPLLSSLKSVGVGGREEGERKERLLFSRRDGQGVIPAVLGGLRNKALVEGSGTSGPEGPGERVAFVL